MTKFETLLKLSEIKGAIFACESVMVPSSMIEELIDELEDSLSHEDLSLARGECCHSRD